ncbi:MAG: TIGR00282 family metallophosphoesterase [Alphaproteobacteria bacterium]|nr:TIGR00282 family metallophosphoesterase [Alphaproteobacteria bacterium]
MKILFLGDVVGRSGRDGVMKHLPGLQKRLSPDVVIINAENCAGGFGVTPKLAREFFAAGATCLTTGNHIWEQKELLLQISDMPNLIRPENSQPDTPGKGVYVHTLNDGRKILITNLLGQLFMNRVAESPFVSMERVLVQHWLGPKGAAGAVQAIFVDFHAETTSEKMSFGHVFDGRVSAVIGTHTHIPTADEQILQKGTAYQTDAGMCGDYNSVIGMKTESASWRFVKDVPGERLSPAEGEATVCGLFIETDDTTGLSVSVAPIRVGGRLSQVG